MSRTRQLAAQLLRLAVLVAFGLTGYAMYQFFLGNLPNLFSYGPTLPFSGNSLFTERLTLNQHLMTHGPFGLFSWCLYYLSGVASYLILGAFTIELLAFGADISQFGYKETLQTLAVARREVFHEQRRREAIVKRREARHKAQPAGWSAGAIVFGVTLGILLF